MGRLASRMPGVPVDRNPRLRSRVGWLPVSELGINHHYYGGDLVTLVSTKASGWGDNDFPAANLAQATDAKRPTFVGTGGPFGNSPYLLFDGNVDTRLVAATAADWTFLHNATAKFFAVSYVATGGSFQVLADTCDWSGTNVGFSLYHRGGTQAVGLQMSNGTGAQALAVESAAGTATDNAAHVVIVTMTAAGAYAVYVDGTSVLSGTWASTPSSAAPTYALTVGGRASATSFDFFGKVGEMVAGVVVPSTSLRTRLADFMSFTARNAA